MKFTLYQARLAHVNVQRKFLMGLCAVLLMIALLQSIFLFTKNERVIITPPELQQSYWVEGNHFSNSYLEEMALFLAHLLLDVTQDNIIAQGEVALRYASPECYGTLKGKLLSDEKRLKKHQLSLHFIPKSIVFVKPLSIDIQGYLASYVGAQRISQVPETYRVTFSQKRTRLFLESFEIIHSERGIQDEHAS